MLFLFWVLCTIIVTAIAKARGRDAVGFFFFALFLSPALALVYMLCTPAPRAKKGYEP